ncbi:MAG TPA: hypothetical protein VGN46_10140 [Luteibacter sp.]|jgi:hypothetical protein|uniref:hypothetical protein n=1 Tax=Luteibacter sp. TaxID=1886636 RepID=UPI002F40AD71
MHVRTLFALATLLAVTTSAQATTDIYAPYPVVVKKSGFDKEKTYREVRSEVLAQCDRDEAYLDAVNFEFLEGWGAAQGTHFIIAKGTCRVHP